VTENLPSGILCVDKPPGITSHDVVLHVRRRFPRSLTIGHAGTLDPLATGLLLILIGRATKKQVLFQKLHKEYEGQILLGCTTDTGDISGKVLSEKESEPFSEAQIEDCLKAHRGTIIQTVPKYSASKYKGVPFYRYARKGLETPVRTRPIQVFSFERLKYEHPLIHFRLSCSSGTYVRALAETIGQKLGVGGTVKTLRRTVVGDFSVEQSLPHSALRSATFEDLTARLIPTDKLKILAT